MRTALLLIAGTGLALAAAAAVTTSATAIAPASSPVKPAAAVTASPVEAAAQGGVDAATFNQIAGAIAGGKPDEIRTTPIPGLYEVRRGTQIVYLSKDGKYGLDGDLYDLTAKTSLTEPRRREVRLKLIAAVPESQMVIFAPPSPKYTITVFTDMDCGYCQKLHSQIAEYNRLGVAVRYLAFPRSGPDTSSWYKAEQVWCSADRKTALTRSKQGQTLTNKICADNPVAQQYALGKAVGLTGTPGIVTSNGDLLPGYVPPDEMIEELHQLKVASR
ncbi:MAG TPA: DsbC family protein [Steroidobacteraceae bacterium]|nr:DsbC family protein [Steroidobacteraceae bacterium]